MKEHNMHESYQIYPIGLIKKTDNSTIIEIGQEYQEAISGLEGFSHILIFYWFHQNDTPDKRKTMKVHPRGNKDNPLTGVFATHSPLRPNLIALSFCKKLKMEGTTIHIDEIDAFDGTPVIDIKPYIPIDKLTTDRIIVPEWV